MAETVCIIVLSGVLFPRTPYGATWSVLRYADDVAGMGQYAGAEAICALCFQRVAVSMALMKIPQFTDVLKWDIQHPECPQQYK